MQVPISNTVNSVYRYLAILRTALPEKRAIFLDVKNVTIKIVCSTPCSA